MIHTHSRLLALAFSVLATLILAVPASAQAPAMQYPLSVAAAGEQLFVADRNLPGIWKVTDGQLELFFQASKKFRTPLNAVRCVAIDREGRLVAGDSATREVFRFDEAGQPQPLTDGEIGIPMAIAVHSNGDLYVADLELHRIVRIATDGKVSTFIEVPAPRGLAFDSEDRLWIVSHGSDHLLRAGADGKLETILPGRAFQFAHNIAVDAAGTAYIADGYAKTICRVRPGAAPEMWVNGAPLVNPVGIALAGDDVVVADPRANSLFRIDREGKLTTIISSAATP